MLIHRTLQEAGAERMLDAGRVYELAPIVAQSLVATGAAEPIEAAMVERAPENAAVPGAPENRTRSRR